jgi:mercuric ion binding protein
MHTGLLRLIAAPGLGLMLATVPLAAISPHTALAAENTSQSAAPHRYKIVVDGLACPFCAYGIEKQINEIKGVQNVQTDIASETVTVTMAPGATLNKDAAAKAVKDAGFTLHNFEEVRVQGGQ